MTSPPTPPTPGVPQLRNPARYHILGEHGRGGLGKVSRAHDLELGRDVAIKELLSRSTMHEVRFMREALITARLEHPGIVPVHEAGRWPDGTPFYAMKLVAGRPLRDLLAERKTVEERLALLHHVIAVADAIAYAHGRNIIHRDLKPSNIIVGDFGETVVIDWGLAKDLSGGEESISGSGSIHINRDNDLTSAGAILGTPAYMAPEQRRGEPVDQRADVYAIGAMLWELCSAERLSTTDSHQRRRILRRSNIDLDLIAIIERSLATDREFRYMSANDLAADLKAFKAGARIATRRYTLRDLIARWTRRHRALTISLPCTFLVAIILGISYVQSIAAERDRTRAALAAVDMQRREAIIANATALLERDPTLAWASLDALRDDAKHTSILRARIKGAGTADTRIPLSGSIDSIILTPDKSHIVLSTKEDRTLYAIDIATYKIHALARDLTAPSVFAATNSDIYVIRNLGRLIMTKIELASGHSEEVDSLDQLPKDMRASNFGAFWQTPDGRLYQTSTSQRARLVALDVSQFSLAVDHVAICDKTQHLYLIDLSSGRHIETGLTGCRETWRWAEGNGNILIPADSGHILLYHDGSSQLIQFSNDDNRSVFALSPTGMIAAVDSQGDGAILLPTSSSFERVRLRQEPNNTAAGNRLVAWSFRSAEVKLLNPFTRQEWLIKAHTEGAQCLYFMSDGRLLTCGRTELRLWSFPPDAPSTIAAFPSPVFHIVPGLMGSRLLETENGEVYLTSDDFTKPTLLHRHAQLAFGAAWCGSRACSAGWDGNIICRAPNASSSTTIASYGVPVRALIASEDHCFAAASNGSIYDLQFADHPLYQHQSEPLRLAASKDGSLIASGDLEGTLALWSVSNRHLISQIAHLHEGAIAAISWVASNEIFTAGFDGHIQLLHVRLGKPLIKSQQWQLAKPIRYMSANQMTVYAALGGGYLWQLDRATNKTFLLTLGAEVTSLATTETHSHAAIGSVDGELFIVDEHRCVVARRLGGGGIQHLKFEGADILLAATRDGHIFRLDLTKQVCN